MISRLFFIDPTGHEISGWRSGAWLVVSDQDDNEHDNDWRVLEERASQSAFFY
jgi:hypothetical protein